MKKIELLHEQVWKRFIRMPYGHVLHFADLDGNAFIPTEEECEKGLPNVLSWCTSIANCSFFSGLYLHGLCKAYDINPLESLKKEIKILADGLFMLCDISNVDGFIARGVAQDGKSYYPLSSDDQCGGWLLGMWTLYHSPASDAEMKAGIKKRILKTLDGIQKNNYDIPTQWENQYNGTYSHSDWRGNTMHLFCDAVYSYFTKQEERFLQSKKEIPDNGIFTRLQISSHGFYPDMLRSTNLIQFWIDICPHLCLRELCRLDPENTSLYLSGMNSNAIAIVAFLNDWKHYKESDLKRGSLDWHKILPKEINPNDSKAAFEEACRQSGEWAKIIASIKFEHSVLGNMIAAAWIGVSSENEAIFEAASKALFEAINEVEWGKLSYNYAFMAEAAAYSALFAAK